MQIGPCARGVGHYTVAKDESRSHSLLIPASECTGATQLPTTNPNHTIF